MSFSWSCDHGQLRTSHGFEFLSDETERASADAYAVFLRVLCHFIVDRLPDRALSETCESLREFHEYYRELEPTPLRLPPAPPTAAKFGGRIQRSELVIDEE